MADDLLLEDCGALLSGAVAQHWAAPWVFGGFSAALVIAAMARRASHPELLSADVSFIGPLRPGPVLIEAEEVRGGGSFAATRAVLRQNGEAIVMGDAWFAPEGTLEEAPAATEPPAGARDMAWNRELFTFFEPFDLRAVDHAIDASTDAEDPAPARVEVWTRATPALRIRTPLERQLLSVMILDAQLLASSVRPYTWTGSWATSHALSVHFTGLPAGDGWFGARTTAHPGHPHTAARGEVFGADERPCAWGLSQGRLAPGKTWPST